MKTILFTYLLIAGNFLFSQEWKLLTSNEELAIFVAEIRYADQTKDFDHQRFIFRYENHSSQSIQITFNRELIYDDQLQVSHDVPLYLEIPPQSTVEYDKTQQNNKLFYLFKEDNKGYIPQKLVSFQIIDLKLSKS